MVLNKLGMKWHPDKINPMPKFTSKHVGVIVEELRGTRYYSGKKELVLPKTHEICTSLLPNSDGKATASAAAIVDKAMEKRSNAKFSTGLSAASFTLSGLMAGVGDTAGIIVAAGVGLLMGALAVIGFRRSNFDSVAKTLTHSVIETGKQPETVQKNQA